MSTAAAVEAGHEPRGGLRLQNQSAVVEVMNSQNCPPSGVGEVMNAQNCRLSGVGEAWRYPADLGLGRDGKSGSLCAWSLGG
jgi:hypothetical protein